MTRPCLFVKLHDLLSRENIEIFFKDLTDPTIAGFFKIFIITVTHVVMDVRDKGLPIHRRRSVKRREKTKDGDSKDKKKSYENLP